MAYVRSASARAVRARLVMRSIQYSPAAPFGNWVTNFRRSVGQWCVRGFLNLKDQCDVLHFICGCIFYFILPLDSFGRTLCFIPLEYLGGAAGVYRPPGAI